MKNYVSKIRKNLELALDAIDALDQLKAPVVPGYQYPAVEEAKEETPEEPAPAPETPAVEADTPAEEPVEAAPETEAPAEEGSEKEN